jgi:hypothetical protein
MIATTNTVKRSRIARVAALPEQAERTRFALFTAERGIGRLRFDKPAICHPPKKSGEKFGQKTYSSGNSKIADLPGSFREP